MDMSEVKAFNAELSGLYENKPPISKAKMSAITRGAIKAIKFYKHVVHSVEKFIQKCKPEYKVPGLYVIDSIVRQSRHQFGQDKDVFAPRFAKNMQQTFANLFRCPPEDKRNIIRVLNLWQKNNVFGPDVIQPLMDMADPNHPLHQEIQQQQNNAANGSSLNVSHNTTDNKMSPVPPPQHTPHASTPMGDQFQDQPSGVPAGVKFNRKLLNDFEYESEDDMQQPEPAPAPPPHNPADALGSILTNPEIMRQLQSLQAQMQMMTGMQIPNLMPMMTDMQQIQQNQTQNLPFLSSQQEQQMQSEPKDNMADESDIEFVETGPQVIEIPDANDSRYNNLVSGLHRSPSPKSRRHRSRSKSPKRRRGRSRTRSRSPRRRRERDRERDRDRDKDKDREKSYKEREAEREKQKEREKKGLPPIKKENLSVCSTTLWVGHLSKLATPEELSDLFGALGGVVSIDVVAPRGCAFVVMERRRDAYKALLKLNKHKLHSKEITVAWAPGKGVKGREWKDYWEADLGVSYLPWEALHARWNLGALSLDALEDGGAVDEETLPPWLPPRIIPKMMDNMPVMPSMPPSTPGMPAMPGSMPALPSSLPNMPVLPTGNMPPGSMPPVSMPPGSIPPGSMPPGSMPPANVPGASMLPSGLPSGPPPGTMPMQVPRMPPPGMTAGLPPGMPPGIPPGIRPPGLPSRVPGLQGDAGLRPAGPLLGFPPGMPPQSIPQPGMVGGFLGGLLGVGGLVAGMPLQLPPRHLAPSPHHPPQQRTAEITQADDAMDLDTEDNHEEHEPQPDTGSAPPPLLSDQLAAFLSKPPPMFNSSEPPPGFNMAEPPPFNVNQPPPSGEEKTEEEKKNERDGDRRDRGRRDRDRDRDRRDRGDRDRRDRDRGRDRDRERDDRRDRDRDRGGRDRRDRDKDRDKDRDRDRDRFSSRDNNNRERSRDKQAEITEQPSNEKTLQERLWEMANGKPASQQEKPREEEHFQEGMMREERPEQRLDESRMDRPPPLIDRPPLRHDQPPPLMDGVPDAEKPADADTGWTQLPPPHLAPPNMAPAFRAELRMRGPPRQPMRGPWMDGPGPGPVPFGPRFNGMGPPFIRPPFEGGPLFEGPPRFDCPPFNRMPFDNMNRPPFDGPMPPFDGPRPPFDGPRPPFDGPRQSFDGPMPFDGPPFEGDRSFDGPPRFDGPPEFFDRNNRRFDDREQFNERGWNGDRDRERDWDRRNEWDDRRGGRDRRSRDHEDRFRDRNDRRRNFDDRRPPREERNSAARDDKNPMAKDDKNPSARDDKNPSAKDEKSTERTLRDEKHSSKKEYSSGRDVKHHSTDDKKSSTKDENNKEIDEKNPTTNEDNNPGREENTPTNREERNAAREERNSRRDKDRKSRWGAAEELNNQMEGQEITLEQNDINEAFAKILNEFAGNEASESMNSSHIEQILESYDNNERNVEDKVDKPQNESYEQADQPESFETESNYDKQDSNTKNCDHKESSDKSNGNQDNDKRDNDSQENNEKSFVDQEIVLASEIHEKKQSFSELMENLPPVNEIAAKNAVSELYDATDAIDTSFSAPEPVEISAPSVDEPAWKMAESSKSDDIFNQTETSAQERGNSDVQSPTENKEGIA